MYLGEAASLEKSAQGVILKTAAHSAEVDKVLVALGRRSNVDQLALAQAGFTLDERGMPIYDPHTLQIEDTPVYIVGDANGYRTLMHEAAEDRKSTRLNSSHVAISYAVFGLKKTNGN